MKKYYTPEFSEFFQGFEYEARTSSLIGNNWISRTYQGYEFISFDGSVSFNNKNARVKYLDKEDIEDLGFKQGKLPYQFFDGIHILVKLSPDNQYSISHIADDQGLFYGEIKNKSELKKILTQLGI